MDHANRARAVIDLLAREFPDARTELDFRSAWELLVATMLSAQCTDARVNQVTPRLFERWPRPDDLAGAPQDEVEEVIRSTGMFRQKARSLRETARVVAERYEGRVPRQIDLLVEFPGVGRKTATVVLGEAFGIAAGVAVDTHVRRVSRRLGLTEQRDPEKIAAELEELLPSEEWNDLSLRLILHGRRVCTARRPRCEECVLEDLCPKVEVG